MTMTTSNRFTFHLTTGEWREELRARAAFALWIATDNDRAYGFEDSRTKRAYAAYDALQAVIRHAGA